MSLINGITIEEIKKMILQKIEEALDKKIKEKTR